MSYAEITCIGCKGHNSCRHEAMRGHATALDVQRQLFESSLPKIVVLRLVGTVGFSRIEKLNPNSMHVNII